ncbi:hypothetical protein DV454_003123 [Geotrichum candidum]|nr:hypothetical protein DV454_003123 [Geotrichum candidum]
MFKNSRSNIKSSAQRALKTKLIEQFPNFEKVVDEIVPKKSQLVQIKCLSPTSVDKLSLYAIGSEILFTQKHNDEVIPTLSVIHKYPDVLPAVRVDRGAIKFILGGANIMCPGLTSKGAQLPEAPGFEKGQVVAIYAEGKQHALAVGILTMSTEEIKSVNKGIGIELISYLGDGLWALKDSI